VLETSFETDTGVVRVIDFMPPRQAEPDVIRIVEGVSGDVHMEMELIVRFDYGSIVPWVRQMDGHLGAIAGPDALAFWSDVPTIGKDLTTRAEFTVRPGERVFRVDVASVARNRAVPLNPGEARGHDELVAGVGRDQLVRGAGAIRSFGR
jgi:hypothetical protein